MERFETQVDRAVAANPEIEELVRRLESEQADEPTSRPRTCPPATRSPRTSSASCASADEHEVRPTALGYASLAGQISR